VYRGEPNTDDCDCSFLVLAILVAGAFFGEAALGGHAVPGSDALCVCSSFDLGAPALAGRGVGSSHSPSAKACTAPPELLQLACSSDPAGGGDV
jgi:hypothetical protein